MVFSGSLAAEPKLTFARAQCNVMKRLQLSFNKKIFSGYLTWTRSFLMLLILFVKSASRIQSHSHLVQEKRTVR